MEGAVQLSVGDLGQVAPVSSLQSVLDEASAVAVLPLGGIPMQVGSNPPSPAAWSALEVAVSPSRGGSGQEDSGPYSLGAPMVATPPALGVEFGQVAQALPSPGALPSPPCGPCPTSPALARASPGPGINARSSAVADQLCVRGAAGGHTPSKISREEDIAFGGIPGPISEGRCYVLSLCWFSPKRKG